MILTLNIKPLAVATLLSILMWPLNALAKLPDSINSILSGSEFWNVSVSPTGKYISVIMKEDPKDKYNRGTLVFLDRETGKPTGDSIRYEKKHRMQITGGSWVSPGIFKYRVAREAVNGGMPENWGDQFIYDMATGKNTRIWTYEGVFLNKVRKTDRVFGSLDILSYLPNDDENMLVAVYPWKGKAARPVIYKFHIPSSDMNKVMSGPSKGAQILANEDGTFFVAEGSNVNNLDRTFFYRKLGDESWSQMKTTLSAKNSGLYLKDFNGGNVSRDGSTVYGIAQSSDDPNASQVLVGIQLLTGEVSTIYDFGFVSSVAVEWNKDGHPSYATWIDDKPQIKIFNKDRESGLVAGLMKAFENSTVVATSSDDDENNLVFAVYSPAMMPEYYIWEKSQGKARYLFAQNEKVNDLNMNSFTSIRYEASDGMKLQGWLLMPRSGKPKALINYIHGGPHGPYIEYSFNKRMQIFAEMGYAVFAPNFRGSGGYGKNLERSGYEKWGTRMLDDMREGAEFVQANFDVGDRVYTAGGSYGGYSSAQNVVRHNTYYDCGIIEAGFFEFEELKSTWDGRKGYFTKGYTDTAMGTDPDELRRQSPIYNLDRVKVPIFVSHGKVDARTPKAGARKFRNALKKTDIDFEYYEYAKEGHGLYFKKNRLKNTGRMQKFLDRCDTLT